MTAEERKQLANYDAAQKKLNEDISNALTSGLYLIYGDEGYLISQNKERLVRAAIEKCSDMNFSSFSGGDINWKELTDAADTMPFFSDKRVIFVADSGAFKGKKAPDYLIDYFDRPLDTLIMIFVESEVDKRNKFYKAISKNGIEINCVTQPVERLVKWCMKKFKDNNKAVSPNVCEYFVEKVGTSMFLLENEIEKLVSYTSGKDEISIKDIDVLCTNTLKSRPFEMADAISRRDLKAAMDIYRELLSLKEAPEKIMAIISNELNKLTIVKDALAAGKTNDMIAKDAGINPYFVKKYITLSDKYPLKRIAGDIEFCVDMTYRVRSGLMDSIVGLESVIVFCCRS